MITYTLTVGARNADASNVSLTDVLPMSTEFVSASGAYALTGPQNNIVSWNLGSLTAGSSTTRTLVVRVLPDTPDGTTISNANYQATASNAATVSGPAVNVTARQETPTGRLSLNGYVDPDNEIVAGTTISFVMTVSAQDAPLENVTLTDVVPAGTQFVSASGNHSRSGANNNLITWNIGSLAAGQSATRTLTVFVPADTPDETMLVNDSYQVNAQNAASVNGAPMYVRVRAAFIHGPRVWVPVAS
jgi:uncharacterized repeat protein (TIGR01451 family)